MKLMDRDYDYTVDSNEVSVSYYILFRENGHSVKGKTYDLDWETAIKKYGEYLVDPRYNLVLLCRKTTNIDVLMLRK